MLNLEESSTYGTGSFTCPRLSISGYVEHCPKTAIKITGLCGFIFRPVLYWTVLRIQNVCVHFTLSVTILMDIETAKEKFTQKKTKMCGWITGFTNTAKFVIIKWSNKTDEKQLAKWDFQMKSSKYSHLKWVVSMQFLVSFLQAEMKITYHVVGEIPQIFIFSSTSRILTFLPHTNAFCCFGFIGLSLILIWKLLP